MMAGMWTAAMPVKCMAPTPRPETTPPSTRLPAMAPCSVAGALTVAGASSTALQGTRNAHREADWLMLTLLDVVTTGKTD